MSEQGWLKREMEVVQCEVATWPAWKRGEGVKDAKRYKLCQDVCYDDGAFVIPAGQVMVREADYDALRDERDRIVKEYVRLFRLCEPTTKMLSELSILPIGCSREQELAWKMAVKNFRHYQRDYAADVLLQAALTPAGGRAG